MATHRTTAKNTRILTRRRKTGIFLMLKVNGWPHEQITKTRTYFMSKIVQCEGCGANLFLEHAVPIMTRAYPRIIGHAHPSPAKKSADGKPARLFSCHLLAFSKLRSEYPNGIVIDGQLIDAKTIENSPVRRRSGPSTNAARYTDWRRGSQQFATHTGGANRSPIIATL